MNGIAEVNLMHKYFIAKKIVLNLFFHHVSVQCSSTQFKCPNDSTCIQSSKKCNGYQDCRDNSDENNCTRYSINIIDLDGDGIPDNIDDDDDNDGIPDNFDLSDGSGDPDSYRDSDGSGDSYGFGDSDGFGGTDSSGS